jgi:hypothetical protein
VSALSDIQARHGSLGNVQLHDTRMHHDSTATHTFYVDLKLWYIRARSGFVRAGDRCVGASCWAWSAAWPSARRYGGSFAA